MQIKKTAQGRHARTYHLPTSSEVAALLPGDATGNLDIFLRCREGDGQELRRISTCHRSYDPLHNVLPIPTGCDGWHLGLKKTDNKTSTAADFYKSGLQIRNNDFNIMFCVKKLAQQYAVDQWATIEAGHLDWVRRNQKSLREDKYQGLMDAVHAGDHNLLRPWSIYQQCGLQRSPASVSKVSHTKILLYRS